MSYPLALTIGGVIVLLLTGYALYLGLQLKRQKSRRNKAEEELRIEFEYNDKEARQSVQIIAKALIQKDISETEAAMRIGFLSQKITANHDEKNLFSVFQQLAEATSHIPILDDWKALEKSEKNRLTQERTAIESKYSDFIKASAEQLTRLRLV
ncbi:MAG: DUF2489 domain-containing protein [Proteobacteria bacterium]|nr:DUF2489 domain-containing protein [Pseudomonadota bacterium]MDA1351836.1 DUF2489 domain-containing protein [Pseudomonadota bacterium]